MLTPFPVDDARRFRDFMTEARYCRPESHEKLVIETRESNLPRLIDQTRDRTLLQTLLRWFRLGIPVDHDTAVELVPRWVLDLLTEHGVLAELDGAFVPLVMLTAGENYIVASDPIGNLANEDSPHVVIWPSGTSVHLAQFTIRRPCRDVLDVGAGSGVQALLVARHCDHVVSTDLNPRAPEFTLFNGRLNGVENIECLTGDTFEPVQGRKFDLIITNPPFFLSPGSRLIFCDNPMELDQYCRKLVREASSHLNEGGFFQMIFESVEVSGQSWRDRLAEWFEHTGCDGWIWHEHTTEPAQYAHDRIRETTPYSPTADAANYNEWMAYYREKRVERIHYGVLAMRRRACQEPGRNWLQIDEMPIPQIEPFGDAVWQAFAARDFLDANPGDDTLLAVKPQLSPHAELRQQFQPGQSGWALTSLNLVLKKGLSASLALDPMVATFVGQCDGARTLHQLVQDLATNVGAPPDKVAPECIKLIRKLIERGFILVPA